MLDIFVHFFDTLFPPLAATRLLRGETDERFIRHFSPHRYLDTIALAEYDNPVIKAAITSNKFHDYEPAATLLATLLTHWHGTQPVADTLFVPIPLSSKRERSRGYNQVTRVITASKTLPTKNLLSRTKDTKPQTSLHRTERFSNMHDAFSATLPKKFTYTRVVLVDDVVTTGATLHAAEAALRAVLPPECEVLCVALAH